MKRFLATTMVGLALCAAPALALADDMAYTTSGVNMRAGPDREYPRVAYIPAGEPVEVVGCLEDWAWCDVIAVGERGWVAARFLERDYDGRMVLIPDYGPSLGFGILSFSFGSYWDSHYRHHSWYGRRSYWNDYAYQHPYRYGSYSGAYRSGSTYRDGNYYRDGQTRYNTTARSQRYVAPQTRDYRS